MAEPTSCCVPGSHCGRVDTLFTCRACTCRMCLARTSTTLPGRLRLVEESELAETGCPSGGVIAADKICTTLRAASPWTLSSTALEVGEQPAA
jgi:hypothetical protein